MNQMKTYRFKSTLLFVLCLIPFASLPATIKYTINEGWRFCLGDKAENRLQSCDDSKWQILNIPHTWNRQDAADDEPGYYRGIGWYRKNLFIDSTAKDKVTSLYFDGANQITELYVNEKLVGTHKGGYTRFCFDISNYILPGSNNLIAVKVDNSHNVAIPPLSADFTFFGGIYRNLYLQVKEKSGLSTGDLASDGVYIKTPSVSEKKALISIQTLLDNSLSVKRAVLIVQSIITPDGKEIKIGQQQQVLEANSFKTSFTRSFTIEAPLLWSPEAPRLYQLKTVVVDAQTKKELDTQLNTFGLRWFHFDPAKGFSLNGRPIKLMGTNRHQCYLDKGNALPDELHVEDIRLLKAMGGNVLRIAHYPQDPLILELCDKLGIITSVEVPIVNEITETNEFLQNSLAMTTEMVKQNFNHPSVVIWAYMNEVMLRPPFADDSLRHAQYCREVHRQATAIEQLVRKLDSGRYTMIPFHGSLKRYEEASLVTIPMIVGWNLYQGWYGGSFADFDTFLADYHAKYPTIPILITEYGADVDDRLHSFKPERFDFTVEYADLYHEHYLETIQRNDYIAGGMIWNLNDFYSESRGDAVPHVNTKGITTRDRQLKNTYLLYKVSLSKDPMAYIGSRSWKYRAGTDKGNGTCPQSIKLYSNQASVDVYHNGVFFKKVAMPHHYQELELPFTNGRNTIELRIGNKTYDFTETSFHLLPAKGQQNALQEINVLLGSNRYFEDRVARMVWMPEQAYTPGSWGYTGGSPVRFKTKSGSLPAASFNIANTDNDPIFQTQREGLQSFRADVPDGQYAVYLYWADLTANAPGKLVYNLGSNAVNDDKTSAVMNVHINEQPVLSQFDLNGQQNTATAIVKKVLVNVVDKKGITVNLEAVKGKTVLNAIRIIPLN
jgi:beta-galactosidase